MTPSLAEFAASRVAVRDFDRDPEFPQDLWRDMAGAGFFQAGMPEQFGGSGGGYAAIAAAESVLAEHGGSPGFAMSWAGHQMVARFFIEGFGSPAQQAALLPELAAGRITASVAISEPGAGAHPKMLSTKATAEAGGFHLDGEKAYVTNGPIADLYIVLAITKVVLGRKHYSAFLVPRNAKGLSLTEGPKIDFLRPSPHCGLKLEACQVPLDAMLGPADGAYEAMALPFRDVEDAVGTAGLVGSLRFLTRRLAQVTDDAASSAPALGELVALTSVLAESSRAVVAALEAGRLNQGDAPATIVGIRSLAAEVLRRAEAYREAHGTRGRDNLDHLLRDLDKSLSIAKGPRLVKQTRLAQPLFENHS